MSSLIRKFINLVNRILSPAPKKKEFKNVSIMRGGMISPDTIIGEYTYIGFNCMITKTNIGRYCSIANNVSIGVGEHKMSRVSTSSLFYKEPYKTLTEGECTLGNDVWVGVNSVVRRGVHVGDGAIIGANSFVNKDVKPFSIVAGSPAKFIKMRFSAEQIREIYNSRYWDMDLEKAKLECKKIELTELFERND